MALRWYLPRQGGSGDLGVPISPTPSASWENTSTAFVLLGSLTKTGAADGDSTAFGNGTGVDPNDVLLVQAIVGPFAPQAISSAWHASFRAREFAIAVNARAQFTLRAVDLAGTTVLSTLIATDAAALSAEWPNGTRQSKRFPLSYADGGVAISATINEHFYLVPEFGARIHSTDSTTAFDIVVQDNIGTDLTETEGVTTDGDVWFQIDQDLVFGAPVDPVGASGFFGI